MSIAEDPAEWKKWYTASVTGLLILMIATEKLPMEISALLALLAVWVPGVIITADAMSGFSNPGICNLGALVIVCYYLEKSRLLMQLIDLILKARHVRLTLLRVTALSMFVSAFLNNVVVIALMMPFVRKWCCENRVDRSKFYIPLAYCVRAGGLLSTIGSTTNLLVIGMATASGINIGMFEQTKIAVILCVFMIIYTQAVYRFIPGGSGLFQYAFETGFITQLEVNEEFLSSLPVPTVRALTTALDVRDEDMLYIFRTVNMPSRPSNDRDNIWLEAGRELLTNTSTQGIPCRKELPLEIGDSVMFVVQSHNLGAIRSIPHVHLMGCSYADMEDSTLVQVVVSDRNPLLGTHISKDDFLRSFNAVPVALRRNGQTTITSLSTWCLQEGDTLLLMLESVYAEELRTKHASSFLIQLDLQNLRDVDNDIEEFRNSFWFDRENPRKLRQLWNMRADWLPLLGFLVYVVLVGLKVSSPTKGAFTLAVLLWLLLGQKKAIMSPVNGKILFVAGCINGFAQAINKSGFSAYIATLLVSSTSSPWGAYCLLNLGTVFLTEFIANSSCGVIVFPIALSTAVSLKANPVPFIFGVIISSSGGFMNPKGDNTLKLIFGPGGYKFREFVKVGVLCVVFFYAINCVSMKVIYGL